MNDCLDIELTMDFELSIFLLRTECRRVNLICLSMWWEYQVGVTLAAGGDAGHRL